MLKALPFLLLGALGAASCQQTPGNDTSMLPASAETTASPDLGAATADGARSAVRRHVQALPNASLFVLDSATALEIDDHWQVLVPRTDWAGRMPNKAAFEVDKKSGAVRTLMVK
ncbi:hypothetical protein LGH70_18640 [Hymenobacter sp. BT635]|uniref:NTF2 fold domain-containing protein n=1 Tax=Hymenobacter nitidus TaxID=2880929 RepID=A0ABS8AH78_9BACT|nr:hypothetical protein [Hymenobacter nitidus]MCB2379621.1 hypothetical protein [Hymenobacter nitidus]